MECLGSLIFGDICDFEVDLAGSICKAAALMLVEAREDSFSMFY